MTFLSKTLEKIFPEQAKTTDPTMDWIVQVHIDYFYIINIHVFHS